MKYVAYFHAHPQHAKELHWLERPHNKKQHQFTTGTQDDADITPVNAVIADALRWQKIESSADDWELTSTYTVIQRPGHTLIGYERVYVFHFKPDEKRPDYVRHPDLFADSYYLRRVDAQV